MVERLAKLLDGRGGSPGICFDEPFVRRPMPNLGERQVKLVLHPDLWSIVTATTGVSWHDASTTIVEYTVVNTSAWAIIEDFSSISSPE